MTQKTQIKCSAEQNLCDNVDKIVVKSHHDLSDLTDEWGVQSLPVPLYVDTKFSKSIVLKLQLCTPAHSDNKTFLEVRGF